MKTIRVEISGYVELEAESEASALAEVKGKFENGELTYEDLSFETECLDED